MPADSQHGTRKWLAALAGFVALVTAVFGAVTAYHNVRKAREEAEKATAEKEKARVEADKAKAPISPTDPSPPTVPVPPPATANPMPPAVERRTNSDEVSDFRADPRFEKYLRANPLLLDVSGLKVIQLRNGNRVVLAVAATELADDSAAERIRAEKVCRLRAMTTTLRATESVQVAQAETLKGGGLKLKLASTQPVKSLGEVLELTTAKVEGLVREMPPVARWKSGDGKRFFLATGQVVDRMGEVVNEVD